MLPSFRVPIVLGEETHHLLVEDVPACVFWQGYPDPSSETSVRDRHQALAAWLRHLLVRITVKPVLDFEWVATWGDDYELPVQSYLKAVGFTPQPVVEALEPAKLLNVPDDTAGRGVMQTLVQHGAFRGCVPPPHVASIFRLVGRSIGLPVAELWLMPSSEFFFNYHVGLNDDEKHGQPLPEVSR